MPLVLVIHKEGLIEEHTVKNTNNLYNVCNYRNESNFELLHTYSDLYEVYGKRKGKSGYENKYEFPAPLDKELYFGKICIVKKNKDLTLEEWNHYEKGLCEVIPEIDSDTESEEVINDNELLPEEYEEE